MLHAAVVVQKIADLVHTVATQLSIFGLLCCDYRGE